MDKSKGRSLVRLASDPVISDLSYETIIFHTLSSQIKQETIILPNVHRENRKISFDSFVADKIDSDLMVYELHQKDNFNWLGTSFPDPVIAAMMIVVDPRNQFHNITDNFSEDETRDHIIQLASSQKRHLQSCVNSIRAWSDLPFLVLYLRNTDKPLALEELISKDLIPEVHSLSYHIEEVGKLKNDLYELLKANH